MHPRGSLVPRLLTIAMSLVAASCQADRHERTAPAPQATERAGIPLLMDLPGVGWLFGRTTTHR